jgi:hypothetical protein
MQPGVATGQSVLVRRLAMTSHIARSVSRLKKRAPQGTLFVFAWSGALETGFDLLKLSDHFFTQSLVHWHLR